ncbi:MAG: hypothetical protein ACRDST_01140, partial [Pseudonocardiaceae bacterium]
MLAVGCVAVAGRRRAPLPCLGVAALVVIIEGIRDPSLPVVLVLTETLHNAVLRSSQRISWAVTAGAGVTTVGIPVAVGLAAGNWRVGAMVAVQAGMVLLLPVWWAMEVR